MAAQIRDPAKNQEGLLFQIDFPEIAENITPRYRFMSAYEQKVEAPNRVRPGGPGRIGAWAVWPAFVWSARFTRT